MRRDELKVSRAVALRENGATEWEQWAIIGNPLPEVELLRDLTDDAQQLHAQARASNRPLPYTLLAKLLPDGRMTDNQGRYFDLRPADDESSRWFEELAKFHLYPCPPLRETDIPIIEAETCTECEAVFRCGDALTIQDNENLFRGMHSIASRMGFGGNPRPGETLGPTGVLMHWGCAAHRLAKRVFEKGERR
jgi:hypothetical protein